MFALTEPEPGTLCFTASCQRQQLAATAVVTYPAWLPSSHGVPMWRESWRRSVPMCDGDMARTITVADVACQRAGVACKAQDDRPPLVPS